MAKKVKIKTKKLLTRRVKITSTGKILHASNFKRHLRRNKSATQKRRLNNLKPFKQGRAAKVRKLLESQ